MKAFESEENNRQRLHDIGALWKRLLGGNNDYTNSDANCEERYFITPEKNFKKMSEESETYWRNEMNESETKGRKLSSKKVPDPESQ